jgi:hypothetical protein
VTWLGGLEVPHYFSSREKTVFLLKQLKKILVVLFRSFEANTGLWTDLSKLGVSADPEGREFASTDGVRALAAFGWRRFISPASTVVFYEVELANELVRAGGLRVTSSLF